jgi:hypothetical protein
VFRQSSHPFRHSHVSLNSRSSVWACRSEGDDGDLSLHNAFGVDGFPRYYILSKDGVVLREFKGWNQNGESNIKEAIAHALAP